MPKRSVTKGTRQYKRGHSVAGHVDHPKRATKRLSALPGKRNTKISFLREIRTSIFIPVLLCLVLVIMFMLGSLVALGRLERKEKTGSAPTYDNFTKVENIRIGDRVYIKQNNVLQPDIISSITKYFQPTTVHNLLTEDKHTYFANDIAVHNKGCAGIQYTFIPASPVSNSTMTVNINRSGASNCNGNWNAVNTKVDGIDVGILGCYADGSNCAEGYHSTFSSGAAGSHTVKLTVNSGSCLCNETTFTTVSPPDIPAIGWHNGNAGSQTADNCRVMGWACDPNKLDQPINVHVYADAEGTPFANVTANGTGSAAIASSCGGGDGNRTFNIPVPARLINGAQHSYRVHAIGIGSNGQPNGDNPLLNGTPKTMTCTPPAGPQGTVTGTASITRGQSVTYEANAAAAVGLNRIEVYVTAVGNNTSLAGWCANVGGVLTANTFWCRLPLNPALAGNPISARQDATWATGWAAGSVPAGNYDVVLNVVDMFTPNRMCSGSPYTAVYPRCDPVNGQDRIRVTVHEPPYCLGAGTADTSISMLPAKWSQSGESLTVSATFHAAAGLSWVSLHCENGAASWPGIGSSSGLSGTDTTVTYTGPLDISCWNFAVSNGNRLQFAAVGGDSNGATTYIAPNKTCYEYVELDPKCGGSYPPNSSPHDAEESQSPVPAGISWTYSTDYSDTTKCQFICDPGFTWNETDRTCEAPAWWQIGSGNVFSNNSDQNVAALQSQVPSTGSLFAGSGTATWRSGTLVSGDGLLGSAVAAPSGEYGGDTYNYAYWKKQLADYIKAGDLTALGLNIGTLDSGIYQIAGDSAIISQSIISNQVALIYDGPVLIMGDITVSPGGVFILITSKDITVHGAVNNLDGFYIADLPISTGVSDEQLVVNGGLISWTGINLQRKYTTSLQAAEVFNQNPTMINTLKTSDALKAFRLYQYTWKEVAP